MANTELTRILMRRRTGSEWTALNEVLMQGEIGVVSDVLPQKVKVGTGITAWNDLPYLLDNDEIMQAINGLSAGQINAEIGVAPPSNVTVANVSVAGTYPLYGGLVVTTADLSSGLVQFRKIGGAWTKVITPIDLSAYIPKSDIVNDLTTGGSTKVLSAEQGKLLAPLLSLFKQSPDGEFTIQDSNSFPAFRITADGFVEFYAVTDSTKDLFNKFSKETTDGLYTIQDSNGNVAFKITTDGLIEFYGISDSTKNSFFPPIDKTNNGLYTIVDSTGNPSFFIKENGEVDFFAIGGNLKDIIKKLISDYIPSNQVENPGALDKYSDINHIITYGQSLSVGLNEAVITSSAMYPNLICFDGVVRTSPYDLSLTGDVYPTNRRISFKPLVERLNDGTAPGILRETPTSGSVEMLATEINKFAYTKFPDLQMKILGSAPGQGTTTVAQLSKGSTYYTQLLNDVQQGMNLSIASGNLYKVLAVTWTQGESDYTAGTSITSYKNSMIQLKNDINNDVKNITNQIEDVIIVMYQTATSNGGGKTYPNIAIAQLDLCLNTPGFYMATAMYQMQYNDMFHIKSTSAKLLGNYYGYVINKVISEGENWKPTHPISVLIQGFIIKMKFFVQTAPLQFDYANTVMLPNKGFAVILGGVDILTNVSIGLDGVSVNLFCSSNPSGALIQYGVNTTTTPGTVTLCKVNMGNLRDSNGTKQKTTILGTTIPMHNWCPIFEYSLL